MAYTYIRSPTFIKVYYLLDNDIIRPMPTIIIHKNNYYYYYNLLRRLQTSVISTRIYQYFFKHTDSNAITLLKTNLNLVLCLFEIDQATFYNVVSLLLKYIHLVYYKRCSNNDVWTGKKARNT